MPQPDAKICLTCGRTIAWRKKWQRNWEEVRHCSDRCRSAKLTDVDCALEGAIADLLDARGHGKTICPSEAARLVSPENWEQLMAQTRAAARRMAARQEIVVTQGGVVVDPSRAKGAIRLRRLG